jgi:hypothetical protein
LKENEMAARVTKRNGTVLTIETEVDIGGSMLHAEEAIQGAVNETGMVATGEALQRFDADGEPIEIGGVKWYKKVREDKYYQTPYGEITVERHVYQRSVGGRVFSPLEQGARVMRNATPRFAKVIAHKLAQGSAADVRRDLLENHGRAISKLLAQDLSGFVSAVVQAKEESWHYATPQVEEEVATIGVGVDGACVLLLEDQGEGQSEGQWREAMTGSLSLYDPAGERLHTIYVGAAPEYGKESFFARMGREITHAKRLYPKARLVGIADGAQSNWDFLEKHVDDQILDFYHATEYVAQAANAIFAQAPPAARSNWLDAACSALKHDWGGAERLLAEWEATDQQGWNQERRQKLEESMRYFRNHLHQMRYADYRALGKPIGSGVTEAACKTLVKQRLCRAGMRWKEAGAQMILSLRALLLTETRWSQFWAKIEQYGVPAVARA